MHKAPDNRNRRVLIIDDNRAIHDDFNKILAAAESSRAAVEESEAALFGSSIQTVAPPQFDVDSAYQGLEGFTAVKKARDQGRPYAMAFVDVRMPPGWDGIETTKRIWEIDPDLQVVICTAYSDYSWGEMFEQLGSRDGLLILKKPFDAVEALQLAQALTEKWWLLQESRRKMEELESRVAERTRELQQVNTALQKEVIEHTRAEDSLRLLGSAVEQSTESILITDAQLDLPGPRIIFVNPAFTKMTGYTTEETIGKTPRMLQGPRTDRAVLDRLRQSLERGQPFACETINYRKDGKEFCVEWQGAPLRDAGGIITHFVAIQRDITQRKQFEVRLFQSQKVETIGKLAGGIAHEFNSILTAIIGQSELLLGDLPAASPLARNATEINQAASRAATLTRQLLAYGRKQLLQPEILDLNRVVVGMESVFRLLMGSDVDTRIVPGAGLRAVKADAGQIEQVIMNIVINARDAMPHGGKLTLETANVSFDDESVDRYPELKAGDYVMLAITDTGGGIPDEVKARLFEPFFTTKSVGQGTGLGLSTCYGIIKQSGGHISLYSEPGRGSTFKIYLPQVEQQTQAPLERLASPVLSRGTETILLVEDDNALREMAGTLLNRLGYTVWAAANGVEALSLKQQRNVGHIDLLFTDIVMPHMSGKELADRVAALYPHTKILFTTAYTENAAIHQGVLDKGVALLQKPYTPSALARKVREVLEQRTPMTPTPLGLPPTSILVVDDMPENIEILSRLLTNRGYTVRRARDGELALQSARQTPPDLILLDINMPGLSGYEVSVQLKQDKRLCEIPIIFLSALEETVDKVRAFAAGGVDYVTKPFQFDEVEARMTTHLKIRRLQVELEQRNSEFQKANAELLRHEELRSNLTAASKLSMWWTYYQQFDCQFVEPECRRSALDFLHVFDKLVLLDDKIMAALAHQPVEKIVEPLREWANDSSKGLPPDGSLNLTNVLLFLTIYRGQIEGQLSSSPSNTDQIVHPAVARRLESYLKWRGHFPRLKSRADPQDVMEKACRSTTIVVVGDIRRSQDLMTYAMDEQDFSRRMVEFISKTRSILDQHGGFFDKFTGDGFIGYFNESICEQYGSNHIDSFIGFVREFTAFSTAHFREWVQFVRKVPGQAVGLAIGADLGRVSFQSLNYHVVAVSESIVWASRMASAAKAEEVLVNNLLYQTLRHRSDLVFNSREASTKSGESFQAWKMAIKGIDQSARNAGPDLIQS